MRSFGLATFVFVATLLLYVPASHYEFINFDDADYVIDNAHVHRGLTTSDIWWAFSNPNYASNWHPLAWVSLMADVDVARAIDILPATPEEWQRTDGSIAKIMHVHNVLLHASNAVLLFALMALMVRGRLDLLWIALLSLLWSLHPLRVEVVCWVSERKELLSVFFMLLSLICYLRDVDGRRRGFYWLSVAFAAAAMMAKPVAVSLPAVVLGWDWCIKRRPRWARLAPFALLAFATCLMTMRAQTEAIGYGSETDIASRLMTFFGGPAVYLFQTLVPRGLSPVYPVYNGIRVIPLTVGIVLFVAMLGVSALWFWRRSRALCLLAFAVAWIYIGLLPMLGIVKVGTQEHSDRYTYWIACGVSAVCALALAGLRQHKDKIMELLRRAEYNGSFQNFRKGCLCALATLVCVYGLLARDRCRYWHDSITLLRDAVRKSWNSDIGATLAHCLIMRIPEGGREEAEMWMRECVSKAPCRLGNIELAKVLMNKPIDMNMPGAERERSEARMLLEEVLVANPADCEARELLDFLDKEKCDK